MELAEAEHRARFFQGALLAQSNDPQRGIELMRRAIAAAESNGARNRRTLYLGHVASAQEKLGDQGWTRFAKTRQLKQQK